MPAVPMRRLLEAGVHFGHRTSRWNPKMRDYIFAARNGIHIIDLAQTQAMLDDACAWLRDLVAGGEKVLFVGTKKQAQDVIEESCQRSGQFYVTHRWMGGMLTNFSVIQRQLRRLAELRAVRDRGDFERMSSKEANDVEDELDRLERNFGGMAEMKRLPGALFVVDCKKERLAVTEANKLRIPIVAIVDSNCDPDLIQHVIPGNDDAMRAVRLITTAVTDSIVEGQELLAERELAERREREEAEARAAAEAAVRSAEEGENPEGTAAVEAGEFAVVGAQPGAAQEASAMAEISAARVKQLRDMTGAGMMDCKRALAEAGGDLEKAVDVLRARGIAKAAGKAARTANEGIVASYLHNSGSGAKLGVLVELNCESDFVAKTDDFHGLAREIALQVAGANPRWVRREDVPAEIVERERAVYREQARGKPANILDRIVDGKLEAWYGENVLLDQVWIRDESRKKRVDELVKEGIARLGENISVARFARFVVGEQAASGEAGLPSAAA